MESRESFVEAFISTNLFIYEKYIIHFHLRMADILHDYIDKGFKEIRKV